MQALVEHYSSKGWLQRVEQCVLHMDISSLDFNQVFFWSSYWRIMWLWEKKKEASSCWFHKFYSINHSLLLEFDLQVVRLCREHGLYGALIYLFNRGLDDFRAPLEELLAVVQNSPGRDAAAIWWFSLFLYRELSAYNIVLIVLCCHQYINWRRTNWGILCFNWFNWILGVLRKDLVPNDNWEVCE